MDALRKNLVILHTIITLLLGWGIGLLLKELLPENYFGWYPFIPVFFYLMGLITIIFVTSNKKRSQLKTANVYLFVKVIKAAMSIIVIGSYFFMVNENKKTFALVFGGYYLLYLGLETYFFYRAEKSIKQNSINE